MKKILLTLLLLPLLTFAQAEGELIVGEQTISYDSSKKIESGVMFYSGETMVASEHGTVMFLYQADGTVLEAHDISGDGEYDTFLSLDATDSVIKMEGEGVGAFERTESVEFVDLLAEEMGAGEAGTPEDDLVGDLDSITIPGSGSYRFYIITAIFLAGAYWWRRKSKKSDGRD